VSESDLTREILLEVWRIGEELNGEKGRTERKQGEIRERRRV